ncbi:MAG: NAD(P)-dependent alcohol dehydrogenase, partial [Pseudomonadota bacterium]
MRAILQEVYGAPALLRLEDIPKPEPGKHDVLVKVQASAINDYDWSHTRGKPFLYRLLFGLRTPKHNIPGMELSGTV